jgi:exonuclease V gamma subunit
MRCVFSNDLNTLVETVAGVLSAESFRSPLSPDWLIVPNQDTGRWLQIELTNRLGSLANTKVTTLSEFLWTMSDAQPDKQFESDLYWAIATVWRQQHPELTEPEYLQQVSHVFELFQLYVAERPDWLVNTEKAALQIQPSDVWQIDLWREIEPRLPTAPHRKLIDAIKEPNSGRLDAIARIIIFNPDRISTLALNALRSWTHNTPCFLCIQSPSPEPWFTQGALELPETHPVLADLCREKAKILSTLGDDETIEGYTQNATKSALSELKTHLFQNKKAPITVDQSVSLVSATSPTQEVVELKQWLIDWLNADPTRALNHVHIVTPNPALYGPIVQRIFHGSDLLHRLPTSPDPLIVQPIEVAAIKLLAEMERTGFKAGSVYTFLSDISVRETLKLSDQQLRQIRNWLVQSGARRGLTGYRHTLQAAKQRLLKGLMADPDAAFLSDSTPTESIEQTDGLDRLIGVLSAIEQVLCAPDVMPLQEAIQLIDRAVNRLTLGKVQTLNLASFIAQFADVEVSKKSVFQWIEHGQKTGLSRPLALNDQLSVTAPQTIRSIPNQVVAVLGANHDTFPQESNEHPWDLVAKSPRPGDLIESEKERQVLADIVLNTEDRLWISWIGKHPIHQTEELPGPGVVSLIDCFRNANNASPVMELRSGISLDSRQISDSTIDTAGHVIQYAWTIREFLSVAAEPAIAFLKEKGARMRTTDFPELDIEPLSIDPLNAFKMKQGFVEQTLTQDTLIKFLTHYPELPDEIDLNGALGDFAPPLVAEAFAINKEPVEPLELTLGEFTVQIDEIAKIEAPRIVIKSSIDGVRGLRALLEGLVLFAIGPTEESLRLVTFNNRVTPFGPIPVDEARQLLTQWLTAISDRGTPCPLIAPLALKTARSLAKDDEANSWIHWSDEALAHQPEYQRVFQNDPHISNKHLELVKSLVKPLLHYLGKSRGTL